MKQIRVSDMTMRQAAVSGDPRLTFKEKLEFAKLLDGLGVDVIEIEGIEREKADSLRIKSIASIVNNSTLSVPVKVDGSDVEAVWSALSEAQAPRLQVQAAVSPARMEYVYHKKADAMLEEIAGTVRACAAHTHDVEFVADDATRSDPAYLKEAIEAAIGAGATTVTVNDDAGNMLPEEFAEFVRGLRAYVDQAGGVKLGVSCSDEIFMAESNAIAAVMAGADEVKATSCPMRLVSLPKLVKVVSGKPEACKATTRIRVTELNRSIAQILRICEQDRGTMSAFASMSDGPAEGIVLSAHDDAQSVAECAAKLGYDLSEGDKELVYEAFLRIASKKESIDSRELDAIIASAALQVPPTYKLGRYVINSGNVIKATAIVQMERNGETIEKVGVGDGPIDAAFAAIEQIAGKRYELDDWQMQSVTEGQEAMGEAVVKLMSQGKVYSGRGISTDIIGSSIRAYVNALNKIVYEEEN